jgi:hypothetical protein
MMVHKHVQKRMLEYLSSMTIPQCDAHKKSGEFSIFILLIFRDFVLVSDGFICTTSQ